MMGREAPPKLNIYDVPYIPANPPKQSFAGRIFGSVEKFGWLKGVAFIGA